MYDPSGGERDRAQAANDPERAWAEYFEKLAQLPPDQQAAALKQLELHRQVAEAQQHAAGNPYGGR